MAASCSLVVPTLAASLAMSTSAATIDCAVMGGISLKNGIIAAASATTPVSRPSLAPYEPPAGSGVDASIPIARYAALFT